ncbi:hypothetical protein OIU76_017227 [Salix suchowensis]|nr:hypothetical protein OIU76_017227 [Salix suchowensis]
MYLASSLARKSTALATSSAVNSTPCKLAFLPIKERKPIKAPSVLSSSGK